MKFPYKQFISKKPFVILFVILSILIVIGGWITFRQAVDRVRIARHNELKAIANFKTGQIANWLEERRSDAMALSRSHLFSEAVNEWLIFRDDPHLQRRIVDRLTVFREQYDYADIVLTTPQGEILLALTSQDQCLAPMTVARIIAASQSQAVTFTDFYYCEMHDRIHLDFIADIRNPAGQSVAALILRTLPEEFLYPLIESWPLPSKTAETLLVRRTVAGDSLVFLNNLRHQPHTALNRHLPLTDQKSPAVQAVLGKAGIFLDQDYRGVPVLTHLGTVPGTDWFMVSKVDRREIYADFYRNLRHFLLLILFLLIVVSTTIVLIYHRRQRDMFSALYADEKERHAMEEQFRTTLYSIGDAVIVTDKNGVVKYLNPVAENLTGWREKEARGKSVREIFKIINEESRQEVESPVQKVIREGSVQGLANHTLLLTRDGREIPIADSGAPIRTEDGEILGVVLVFRDQSAERAAQRALRASEEKFRTLIDQAAEMVFYHDLEGRIVEANQTVIRSLGYSKAELQALNIMDIDPSARERDDISNHWKVMKPEDPAITFEAVHRRKDGSIYPVEVTISKVILPEGEFILGMARDIAERRRAEAALKASEMRFRLLAETAPVGIVIADKDDKVVFVSKKFTDIFGYTIDDIPTIEEWYRCAYPDESVRDKIRMMWAAAVEKAKQTQTEIEPLEYAVVCKDGGIRQVEFRITATADLQFVLFTDITERKRIREALELAVQSAGVGLWEQDLRTGVIIRNEEWARMLGYELSEVAANIDFFFDAIHPDDLPRVKETIAAHENGQTDFLRVEQRMRTKSGAWKWILNMGRVVERDINGKPVRAAGVHLDITEHKQADEKIRESEERYRLLMDNSLDAVLLTIPDGRILSANRAACEMFQMSEAELCTAGKDGIVDLQDPRLPVLLEKRSRDGSAKGELTYIRKDGSKFEAEVSSSIFYNSKGEPRISMIIRDISERKQMEANLKASEEQLRQTQKMEALGRLASGIAHDFNNILSIVLGHATLLKMGQRTPEKIQHSIATIERASQRGADLVKRLLTLARKSEPEARPLKLSEIVADTVKLLQETFPKTIIFETDVDPRLPLIMADASQIQQVLMNLSVNARDAMPKGGTLSFYADREAGQRLRQRHPDAIAAEYVKLCIRDTGVGMDKTTTERIFEPFYTTKEQGQGTGLGLATVHGIIRNHNGFIEVESAPAAGATFRIYLPVPVTQDILDVAGAENDAEAPGMTGGNETILLIEDEESIIEMLTTVFGSQGYQVIVAKDGVSGIEKYSQAPSEIDLIISDMGLPRLTGDEVFYRIRKINPDARVIIASGFVDPGRKSELYKAGLARFIQKPYFPMDILKVVREILDESSDASKEKS
ncbi:MAG: PAS domain S-box protein [Fidelibacterota bacterium]